MKVLKVLSRVYTHDISSTLLFYESLFSQKTSMRFSFPAIGCELAQVADILIIAGDEKSLAPFRETRATFLVDRIDEFIAFLSRQGGEIIRGPQNVPTGINCTIRHPDGTVIEYVEHKKQESNKEKEHA